MSDTRRGLPAEVGRALLFPRIVSAHSNRGFEAKLHVSDGLTNMQMASENPGKRAL
jgi:hypothetical protein